MIRCYFCKNWFTPKRKNQGCCTSECSKKRAQLAYNKSSSGTLRRMMYYRRNKLKIKARRQALTLLKRKYGNEWREHLSDQK